LEQFGKDMFDKSLSANEAALKSDEIAIAAAQEQLRDEVTLANSEAENGGDQVQSDALNFSIGSIEQNLKMRLTEVFTLQIEAIALKTCKVLESKMEVVRSKELLQFPGMTAVQYEEKVTSVQTLGTVPGEAVEITRLIMDVVLTMKIQRWVDTALDKKRIDKVH
jgi:hypothetical protein